MDDHTRASRFLAYILRHHPEDLDLKIDPQGGWVCIRTLVAKVNKSGRFRQSWTSETIEHVVSKERRRFRIRDGKICALNGHSINGVVPFHRTRRYQKAPSRQLDNQQQSRSGSKSSGSQRIAPISNKSSRTSSGRLKLKGFGKRSQGTFVEAEPPELLFYVAHNEKSRKSALDNGLKARPGQFLKFLSDWHSALAQAKKQGQGRVLVVEARRAFTAGVRFILTQHGIFRAAFIPKHCLWKDDEDFFNQRSAGCVLVHRGEQGARFVLIRTRPRDRVQADLDEGVDPVTTNKTAVPNMPRWLAGDRLRKHWDDSGRLELPKGKIEEGETPPTAALRELREETGIDSDLHVVCPLPSIYYVYRIPGGRPVSKSVAFFLVRCVDRNPVFRPKNHEGIISVEWHDPDAALREIAFDNLKPILRCARDLIFSGADLRSEK